uniref:Uncharacterized protein n=1 Tax=Anguilla anguilla TaxID=7936 RepID=A0A0E9SE59_ANGAN
MLLRKANTVRSAMKCLFVPDGCSNPFIYRNHTFFNDLL